MQRAPAASTLIPSPAANRDDAREHAREWRAVARGPRASVIVLAAQLEALECVIGAIEKRIKMQHRSNEASQRVETIPGIGVIGATAIVATVADPTIFRSGIDAAGGVSVVSV